MSSPHDAVSRRDNAAMALIYRERPAEAAPAEGLLVLHHGRGADEADLLPLGDVLDPARRLHVVSPQAPLTLTGWPGYHWYVVPQVGYPDPTTFAASYRALAAFHEEQQQRLGIAPSRTVLGGFSMGTVMSYALGLGSDRPVPAGILALSGFVPTVEGWEPDLGHRQGLPVFIRHGRTDPVIGVDFARQARELLTPAGLEIDYREFDGGHFIEPASTPAAAAWLSGIFTV